MEDHLRPEAAEDTLGFTAVRYVLGMVTVCMRQQWRGEWGCLSACTLMGWVLTKGSGVFDTLSVEAGGLVY